RRSHVPGAGPQLRSAASLGDQQGPGERARVADLRRR
ncbi:DeoR family transcriptional regulator, partial [Streptomyces melanogenes]